MSDLDLIKTELAEITHLLSEASEQINNGITLNLSDIGPRAQELCSRILTLPPEQALEMLGEMNLAVDKLNSLSEQLKSN